MASDITSGGKNTIFFSRCFNVLMIYLYINIMLATFSPLTNFFSLLYSLPQSHISYALTPKHVI